MFQLEWKLCLLSRDFMTTIHEQKGKGVWGKKQKQVPGKNLDQVEAEAHSTHPWWVHSLLVSYSYSKQSVFIGVNKYWLQKYSSGPICINITRPRFAFCWEHWDVQTVRLLNKPSVFKTWSIFFPPDDPFPKCTCMYLHTWTHTLTHTVSQTLKETLRPTDPNTLASFIFHHHEYRMWTQARRHTLIYSPDVLVDDSMSWEPVIRYTASSEHSPRDE